MYNYFILIGKLTRIEKNNLVVLVPNEGEMDVSFEKANLMESKVDSVIMIKGHITVHGLCADKIVGMECD